jgi:PAS domain S-box-containing protein
MWAIHDDIRGYWKEFTALLETGPEKDPLGFGERADSLLSALRTAITEMFYKEENILFPTAMQKLTQREWGEIRRQEASIGYCFVEPGERWLPVEEVSTSEGDLLMLSVGDRQDAHFYAKLELDTGVLSREQVNLILNHLPVEITFVDEDDRVRYFSQSKEVIFPRQAAIIGRKVQNCHPPASVDRVERILNDFRAGRRDVAEFWIQMRGKFVHIRYFAVRDQKGSYRGTMEVTQEITRIRELEGERRLEHDV